MKKLFAIALLAGVLLAAGRYLQRSPLNAQAGALARENGDVDGDGQRNINDPIYLLNWLFIGGPAPVALAGPGDLEARVAALEAAVSQLQSSPGASSPLDLALAQLAGLGARGFSEVWNQPLRALAPAACGAAVAGAAEVRLGELSLGGASLLGARIDEGISMPTRIEIVLELPSASLEPAALLGAPLRLTLARPGGPVAASGAVERIDLVEETAQRARYRIVALSSLNLLGRGKRSRIFQGQSDVDLVKKLLTDADLSGDFTPLKGTYPKRDFVVQYQESDLDFISRLMEEEGIFYFFEETEEGAVLHFGDSIEGRIPPAATGGGSIYRAGGGAAGEVVIAAFRRGAAAIAGKASAGAYDFQTARAGFATLAAKGGEREEFEFDAGAADLPSLRFRAGVRLERQLTTSEPVAGEGNDGHLRPGHEVLIEGAGTRFGGKYLVTHTTHVLAATDEEGKRCLRYGNSFESIPAEEPFRPARVTPKPRLPGTLTGVVTGPAGEEIYPDAYGRVKVHFFWDRDGKTDEASSAWIRVSQSAAGRSSGFFCLPEVDDEVIVAFEHGDISQPVILGSLWNGDNLPPEQLPASKSRRTFQSKKAAATPDRLNRILLDDTGGAELLELSSPHLNFTAGSTTVAGPLLSTENAGPEAPIEPGHRARDNSIVAWARVDAAGALQKAPFGVKGAQALGPGVYRVTTSAEAATPGQLVPMVAAEVLKAPATIDDVRLVAVQEESTSAFLVFINDGRGRPVANGFVFLATAR